VTSTEVPADILAQQAALEQQWAGQTLCDALASTAERYGDMPAYSDRDAGGAWQTITWAQTRELALQLAAAFAELGLRPGDKVALMMPNRVEHVLADMGVLHAGGIPVTFYATLAAEQIAYMAGNCDAKIAVIDGASELARWQQVLPQLPSLRKVIVRNRPDDVRGHGHAPRRPVSAGGGTAHRRGRQTICACHQQLHDLPPVPS
jgi:long-chain acyl-CoA synthetase